MSVKSYKFNLPTEDATAKLAAQIGQILHIGDVLLLSGDIGAGKSFFCRALIRSRTQTTDDIPSPTFTLVQTYPDPNGEIWHCDLYRLSTPDEAIELGFDDAFEDAICLIEWPDRLGSYAPKKALLLFFEAQDDGHKLTIDATQDWVGRLDMLDV